MHVYFAAHRSGTRRNRRRGITLVEVTVAAGLLAVLMATSMQMIRFASRQQRVVERRVVALQTVQAIAELVGNIPWDQLTPAAIDQIDVPAPAKPYLPGGRLAMAVADEADPLAKRISIELTWNGPLGQSAGTARLTTWAFPDQSQPPE